MLWIWVKSWDVMMAFVTILSDFLFAMLSTQMQARGIVQGQNELQRMDLAIASFTEMDPTFQLSTYYTIISITVIGIPSTTAYLILGSLKGGASIISQGITRNAVQATGHFLSYQEQKAVSQITNDFNARKEQLMHSYNDNAEKGLNPYAGLKG